MTTELEAERKFALAGGQELPDLARVITPGPVAEFDLEATYYDAPDFRLTRAWQVIRRRSGGHDAGWHLKLPGRTPDERLEIRSPLGATRVPPELRDRVADTLAGAPLLPVAVLRTHRREQQLLGPTGGVDAVTCLDLVTAQVGRERETWREAEVELVGGDRRLLDVIEAEFAAAGIRRAASGSKIARALERAIAAASDIAPGPDSSAGVVVLGYLAEQVGVLQSREAEVRVDGFDAVHRSRVATRRLRSALRTYGGVFRSRRQELRAELRWHAEELGAPRDAEVLRERLLAAAAELSGTEAVSARLASALAEIHTQAHADLVTSMEASRYDDLHFALEALLARPGFAPVAGEPASAVLPPMLARSVRRVRRLADHAHARPNDLTRWHEVRKAAKAARYGAEVLVPVLGDRAEEWRAAWEAVTEALGGVQDAVVAQRVIGELAWQAMADGLPRLPFDDLRHDQDRVLRESLATGRAALSAALRNHAGGL